MLPISVHRYGSPAEFESVNDTTGNKAAASGTATLAHDGKKTLFVTGFEVTGGGATAASVIQVTLAGLANGKTFTYDIPVPAGVTGGISPLVVDFPVPIPANDLNTDIVLTIPSFGAGNTNACANLHGFKIGPV